ncbi:DsbA family protein [Streptomyces sp. HUAS MG47]|uniref:DsbA family oxidoreductase n=1 Tax=Streptomyces solicamelliae TaxID=3231716 RepID=UPI0038782CA4
MTPATRETTPAPDPVAPTPVAPVVVAWSDLGCPWASLALHTLRTTAAARGQDLLIDHRAFPLELFNRQPTPKHIVDAEVVMLGAHFPELGWRLWNAPAWEYPSTVLPAIEAVQAAKAPEIGGLRGSDQLDAALRRAFYTEHRCIAVHSVILDLAADCPDVDAAALEAALARGAGRREVYEQWHEAQGPDVQGSPHFLAPGGYTAHNPGPTYVFTGDLYDGGFPRLDAYDPGWAVALLDSLAD